MAEKWANRRYLRKLRAGAAAEQGFGFVHLSPAFAGRRGVAKYLAKYVAKEGASGRPELAETALHPDCPPRPVYVASSLTLATRATMRNLRLRRYFFVGGVPGYVSLAELERWFDEGARVVRNRFCAPSSWRRGPPLAADDPRVWEAIEATQAWRNSLAA